MPGTPATGRVGVGASSSPSATAIGRVTATVAATPAVIAHPLQNDSSSGTNTMRPKVAAAAVAAAPSVPLPGVITSPDGSTMLTAPLSLQATVLSQPSFYPSLGEDMGDFTEEGDILHAVLGDPWSRVRVSGTPERKEGGQPSLPCSSSATPAPPLSPAPAGAITTASSTRSSSPQPAAAVLTTSSATLAASPHAAILSSSIASATDLCVQPVLSLPRKVSVSLACEEFRALLCFHNSATYPLSQAHFNIGVAQPPAPLRRPLLRCTVPTLPGKSNYSVIASVPLGDASNYALAVTVEYTDPSGRQRQLTWNSTLKTEQPIMEVQPRRFVALRRSMNSSPAAASSSPFSASSSLAYAPYQVMLTVKNMSSVPLYMTATELLLPNTTYHNGKPLFRDLTPPPPPALSSSTALAFPLAHASTEAAADGDGDAPAAPPVFLMPGDTHSFAFVIGVYAEELRHATVVHGQGGVATRLLSPRLASFGAVRWTWCRANGETGRAQSAPLRVEQLLAEPEVELRVVRVAAAKSSSSSGSAVPHIPPSTSPAQQDGSEVDAASSPSPPLRLLAGSPVTVDFAITNYSDMHRYDIALKVRVERLAPQWLYTGPTVRPLGLLNPASTLTFSLTLLPWQVGWLSVLQSALEVVDAQMPEAVLWPPASAPLLQPVPGQSSGMNSNGGAGVMGSSADGVDRPLFVATTSAVAEVAMKALPPSDADVLCEVLVL